MIFEIGQSYKNNMGTYTILAIHNNTMDVCFTDGHRQTLSTTTQSRIYENRAITQSIEQNLTVRSSKAKRLTEYNYSDYWTLGFLLVRLIYLQHKVMYDKQDESKINYFDATGQELDAVKTGVFYYRKGANQWGNQGVITFHANDSELSLLKFSGKPKAVSNSTDIYIVSDINYFYFMLNNGFRPGNKQDRDSIRNNIPKLYTESFDKGCTYAQGR